MHARRRLAAVVTALALVAGAAHARGQLQTRQTGIEIDPGSRAGRLVLANTGDAPVSAQVRVYAWTQHGGFEDRLEPSTGLVASPPIVTIPAGAEQLVRIVRPSTAAPAQELTYRVVVDELPGGDDAGQGIGVTVRMRFVLPVFVRAANAAPADLHCWIDRDHAGANTNTNTAPEPALACRNAGGHAAQFGATRLLGDAGGAVRLSDGLLGYVLAGSTRRWPLQAAELATLQAPRSLEVRLNGQPARLALGAAR